MKKYFWLLFIIHLSWLKSVTQLFVNYIKIGEFRNSNDYHVIAEKH